MDRAWGFFFWVNRYIYTVADGLEGKPQFNFKFKSGIWLNVTSVVNGNLATIYVNGTKLPTVKMLGDGSEEAGDKYVGLFCHKLVYVTGMNFRVRNREYHNHLFECVEKTTYRSIVNCICQTVSE